MQTFLTEMATTFSSASSKKDHSVGNSIVLGFEIAIMVISVIMIIIGLLQNKKSQTGLSALNGGNEELFSNSKERGSDKVYSIWMMTLGIIFFVITLVICIVTNTVLA